MVVPPGHSPISAGRGTGRSALRLAILLLGVAVPAHPTLGADPPRGEVIPCTFAASRVFPGTVREYWIYVPAQYDGRTPACVHVNQDGIQFEAPRVFDRLIHEQKMPVTIGVFVMHGRVPAGRDGALDRYNRSYEYDGLGDDYARFLLDELLPDVETRKASDGRAILLSKQGADRSIGGTSSGAIAAFTAAWERPDAFTRVFSGIGTYVGLRGGHEYATLVRKLEPKPIRVFLQGGERDLNIYGGDWWIANQAMERSLSFAGYEVRHAWGDGGHDNRHATDVFPEAMEWLWSGWPAAPGRGAGSPQLQEILLPGEEWRLVGEGYEHADAPAVEPDGSVIFHDVGKGGLWRLDADLETVTSTPHPTSEVPATGAGRVRRHLVVATDRTTFAAETSDVPGAAVNRVVRVDERGDESVLDEFPGTAAGICLSPDQSLLYVADGTSHWVYSYSVAADGTLSNRQRYYHLHVPDDADDAGAGGLRVDRDGRLWVATRMGLQVCDQAGRVNVVIPVPSGQVTDLVFGGPGYDTVVVTCGDKVWARKVKVRGVMSFEPPVTPAPPRL